MLAELVTLTGDRNGVFMRAEDLANDDIFMGAGVMQKIKAGLSKAKGALPEGTYSVPGYTFTKEGKPAGGMQLPGGMNIGAMFSNPFVLGGIGVLALMFLMRRR